MASLNTQVDAMESGAECDSEMVAWAKRGDFNPRVRLTASEAAESNRAMLEAAGVDVEQIRVAAMPLYDFALHLLSRYLPGEISADNAELFRAGEHWLVAVKTLFDAAERGVLALEDAEIGLDYASQKVIFGTKTSNYLADTLNEYIKKMDGAPVPS